jgi:hypothetical protein
MWGFATDQKGRHVMPHKTYRLEEVIAKLRQARILLDQGEQVPEVVHGPHSPAPEVAPGPT